MATNNFYSSSKINPRDYFANNYLDNQNKGLPTRFYSSLDAELYFGSKFVDDIAQIVFQINQNTLPLFGYNSYTFDDIAVGSRIVNGQFIINFTKTNYLYDVLAVLNEIFNENTKPNSNVSVDNKNNQNSTKPYKWNKNFDIVIYYGGQINQPNKSTSLILSNIQITGCTQQFSADGEPIQEIYSFIGKDFCTSEELLANNNAKNATNKIDNKSSNNAFDSSSNVPTSVSKAAQDTSSNYSAYYKTVAKPTLAEIHHNMTDDLINGADKSIQNNYYDNNYYKGELCIVSDNKEKINSIKTKPILYIKSPSSPPVYMYADNVENNNAKFMINGQLGEDIKNHFKENNAKTFDLDVEVVYESGKTEKVIVKNTKIENFMV